MLDIGLPPDVGAHIGRFPARGSDLFLHPVPGRLRPARNDHRGALAREPRRDGTSDATRRAGHERDLVRETLPHPVILPSNGAGRPRLVVRGRGRELTPQ